MIDQPPALIQPAKDLDCLDRQLASARLSRPVRRALLAELERTLRIKSRERPAIVRATLKDIAQVSGGSDGDLLRAMPVTAFLAAALPVGPGVLSITLTDSVQGSSDSFADRSIGAAPGAGERRYVVVAVSVIGFGVTVGASPTIGGSVATVDAGVVVPQSGTVRIHVRVLRREVSTGTTATIDVDGSGSSYGITVWRVITTSDIEVIDFATHSVVGIGTLNLGVDTVEDGVAVAHSQTREGGSNTWTGLTEDVDVDMNGADWFRTSASAETATAETPRAIQVVCAVADPDAYGGVAVSYGPT